MNEALESFNDVLRQLASEHSVALYDAAKTIPKSAEFFYDDVHLNVGGARRIGSELASLLMQKALVPSGK